MGIERRIKELGVATGTRYTLIDRDGTVIADSEKDPATMDNYATRPEIIMAQASGMGVVKRFSDSVKEPMMYLALPVKFRSLDFGFVRAALPLTEIGDQLLRLRLVIFLSALLTMFLSLVIGYVLVRRTLRPLNKITGVAHSIAQGNFDQQLEVTSDDELGTLATAFNMMLSRLKDDMGELKKMERIRRDFVANVSHELKTPITAIKGLVETLIDDKQMQPDTHERFLVKIQNQSNRLATLVSDLLTISRLESQTGDLDFKEINLNTILAASAEALKTTCELKGIHIHVKLPALALMIMGDAEALRQAIDNLLDNAIKYTPAGGEVILKLEASDEKIKISVTDTGSGIAEKHLPRLFERFYRVDKARSRELGGTGLGLAIVKHVVLAHKGEVFVSSTVGKGSVFHIHLPRA